MIAVWIMYEKQRISKGPFQIIELGPGRGTLIKDILRVRAAYSIYKNQYFAL